MIETIQTETDKKPSLYMRIKAKAMSTVVMGSLISIVIVGNAAAFNASSFSSITELIDAIIPLFDSIIDLVIAIFPLTIVIAFMTGLAYLINKVFSRVFK